MREWSLREFNDWLKVAHMGTDLDLEHKYYFQYHFKGGAGDSQLYSQHCGRLRWEDFLSAGVQDQPGQHSPFSTKYLNIT